jgi:hypothetical protein
MVMVYRWATGSNGSGGLSSGNGGLSGSGSGSGSTTLLLSPPSNWNSRWNNRWGRDPRDSRSNGERERSHYPDVWHGGNGGRMPRTHFIY